MPTPAVELFPWPWRVSRADVWIEGRKSDFELASRKAFICFCSCWKTIFAVDFCVSRFRHSLIVIRSWQCQYAWAGHAWMRCDFRWHWKGKFKQYTPRISLFALVTSGVFACMLYRLARVNSAEGACDKTNQIFDRFIFYKIETFGISVSARLSVVKGGRSIVFRDVLFILSP